MKDKTITCIQCESEFVFTVAEQARFLAHGFTKPRRCPECRKKKDRGIEINDNGKDKGKRKHGRRKDDLEFYET
jgi:hypothetical protein